MSSFKPTNIEIFVGDAIEHESERRVLELLVDELGRLTKWATILANVHVDSHQVDFIVGSDLHCVLIEAKRYSRPIRGDANGSWEFNVGAELWRPVRNAYKQALDAKNALRDLMHSLEVNLQGYPDACVVGVPCIPAGSKITASDFKVRIVSLDDLCERLRTCSSLRWPQERWREFAALLKLTPVGGVEEACSSDLFEARTRLDKYRAEFLRTYQPDLATYQSDVYFADEAEFDAASVAAIVLSSGDDLMVRGPSGCGKSLLGKHIAVEGAAQGFIPIIVQAKHFLGRLGPLLEQEVGLLGTSNVAIASAARRMDSPILLIVDGYNECNESLRLALTRSLAAMSRRGAKIVVSSQIELVRPDLLALRCAIVREPTQALKAAIVQAIAPRSNAEAVAVLLGLVNSGFEADVVGQVGDELSPGLSRSALIDAYARKRLGAMGSEGVRLLAEIAGWLHDRFTFSLSARDLDRLIQDVGSAQDGLRAAYAGRLLTNRVGRVSFTHEMLLNAFAAESAVRRAHGSASRILAALVAPRFDACRVHILGAIDDESLAAEVLDGTGDRELLMAAADGHCGKFSKEWVRQRCQDVLTRAREEIRGIRFAISADAWMNVRAAPSHVVEWSQPERSIQHVIAAGLGSGRHVGHVLDIIEAMDQSLTDALTELRDEAREKKVALRSGLFACAYFAPPGHVAISVIAGSVHNSMLSLRQARGPELAQTLQAAWTSAHTHGQIYLLLALGRHLSDRNFVVPHVLPLFGDRWRFLPYHLKLDLLDFARSLWDSEGQPWRDELIDHLQGLLDNENPVLNTSVFEALQSLGALDHDSDEHADSVRKDLQELLRQGSSDADNGRAWGLYTCQFDHPLSSAYCEAINELSEDETGRFLAMACDGADKHATFLSSVIHRLGDLRHAPAAAAIARRTALPAKDSFMPQEAVAVFVSAHVALGQLGAPLPPERGPVENASDAAVLACGDLFYWASRSDLPQRPPSSFSKDAVSILSDHNANLSLAAIRMVSETGLLDRSAHSLIRMYPAQVLDLARKSLSSPVEKFGYERHSFSGDITEFALRVIGRLGDCTDLPAVKSFGEDPKRGRAALLAVREIEERSSIASGSAS